MTRRRVPIPLEEVSRRLGEQHHTPSEDGCPDKLNGDGNSPCGMVLPVLGRVEDNGGEESSDGDGELV